MLNPPLLDQSPCLAQALEPVHVQTFIAELPIEALGERVLHRSPWSDEVKSNSAFVRPAIEVIARELCPIVQGDDVRLNVAVNRLLKRRGYRLSGQLLSHLKTYAFPTDLIDGREDSESPSVGQLIAREVNTPVFTYLCFR